MKFSLTSTSTSSESMSTIVPMPVRVKPPPAEIGDTISPFLRGLDGHDAGERRAHHGVLEIPLGGCDARVGDLERARRDVEPRARGVVRRLRRVERLRADHRLRVLQLVALVGRLRVLERDARRDEIRLGLRALRAGLLRGRARVRVVEPRDDLPGLDALALFDRRRARPCR